MMQQYMIHRACGISEPRGRTQRNLKQRWTIMISGSMWSHFTSEETWDSENKIIPGHIARGWQTVTQFSESSVLFCSLHPADPQGLSLLRYCQPMKLATTWTPYPLSPQGLACWDWIFKREPMGKKLPLIHLTRAQLLYKAKNAWRMNPVWYTSWL